METTPYLGPPGWQERIREGVREHEAQRADRPSDLSRYERREEIGRGGMGVVYRAFDRELNRFVALKVVTERAALDPHALRRFRREGKAMACFSHPNLVAVHDMGEQDGLPFIVMELVEGDVLSRILLQEPAATRRHLELLEQVTRGVAHAHAHGIVHRDLKPANILITAGGQPKVTDFGLAHVEVTQASLTRSGAAVGTPLYMAPEQARGSGEITTRTDVYALGAILYEMLTGAPPHAGGTAAELFGKILNQEPIPVRHVNPRVPRDLATICMKALERNPAHRYPSAKEFGDDLRRYLEDQTILAKPPPLVVKIVRILRRHRTVSVAAALLLSFLVSLGGYATVRSAARASRRDRFLIEAEGAMRAEDWARAAARYAQAQELAPDNRDVEAGKRAAQEMDRAVRARVRRESLKRNWEEIALPSVAPSDPPSKQKGLWAAQDDVRRMKQEAVECGQEAEQALLSALQFLPDLEVAKRSLAELYSERYDLSRLARDRAMADRWARLAIAYGGTTYQERLFGSGSLTIRSLPPGAAYHLYRYEERDRRLIPLPCASNGEILKPEPEIPSIDPIPMDAPEETLRRAREGTAYPVEEWKEAENEVSFPARLIPGSYLVLLEMEGYANALYPIWIEPHAELSAEVKLIRTGDQPPKFVYVPGGRFIAGSDPMAIDKTFTPRTDLHPEVAGFFMARYPVTCGEYAEFLNHLPREEALQRIPRFPNGNRYWTTLDSGEPQFPLVLAPEFSLHPVFLVSGEDATAYARWYTQEYGKGKWDFRLPTEDEYEKAARGVDGRYYAWGDQAQPGFAANTDPHSKATWVDNRMNPDCHTQIGRYPADESLYRVRDIVGLMMAFTCTEDIPGSKHYLVKGGAWESAMGSEDRPASRLLVAQEILMKSIGIRLVAKLRRE